MEKITTIKRLQAFMIAFLVSVIVKLITSVIPIEGALGAILWWLGVILSIVTYILLWVSFANSRKDNINSKKYLLLVILITVLTVVIGIATIVWSMSMVAPLLESGITNPTPEQILALMPNMDLVTTIFLAIGVVTKIIYLGLGTMIFLENKKILETAEAEHDTAFNQ